MIMHRPCVLVGSFALIVLCASVARAQQDIVWTRTVNATASGNTLQKTAGCDGCQDAGGVSQQQIGSGTGGVQFVPGVGPGQENYAGLSHTTATPLDDTQLDYAFAVYGNTPNNVCEIRERGAWRGDCTFIAGDVLRISIEAGPVVRYYRNGAAVYVSTVVPADYPYVLGADLFNIGTTVGDAAIMTPSLTNWTNLDIGNVVLTGSASYSGDVLTVQGAGADIGGTVDAFHFVYQTLSGDGELVTKLDSIQNTNPSAKAGVMMRDGLTLTGVDLARNRASCTATVSVPHDQRR
jgi:hypothetical protein